MSLLRPDVIKQHKPNQMNLIGCITIDRTAYGVSWHVRARDAFPTAVSRGG